MKQFVCGLLFLSLPLIALSDSITHRPCGAADMVGIWKLVAERHGGQIDAAYSDLLQPYQFREYGKDGAYKLITASKALPAADVTKLLKAAPKDKWSLKDSLISTHNQSGQKLESYQCNVMLKDQPGTPVKKGMLSLDWIAGPNNAFISLLVEKSK